MSYHNPIARITKRETADFIVPERLRSARTLRGYPRKYCAEQLGITDYKLGLYENGHLEIPKELLFGLQKLYNMPRGYFYKVIWERV